MHVKRTPGSGLRVLVGVALMLGSVLAAPAATAQAAAPEARCETGFSRTSTIRNASGVFASNAGRQGGIPAFMSLPGWACPAPSTDTDWTYYYGLDRWTAVRTGTTSITGVTFYVYNVTQRRRSCACAPFTVVGSQEWTLSVPYHLVPRLATNSGLLNDSLYVTRNGARVKLADVKMRLAFVEDPVRKLQRGYFSELSVVLAPGTPTTWTYTTSKQQGQACGSYPETIGGQEYWYLRCDVDITFLDPTKRTSGADVTLGGEAGKENAKAVGGVTLSSGSESQGRYVYYKAHVKIALGVTWYQLVRRAGTCQNMSLSYVVATLNPYVNYVDVRESYALHGGRCRFNSGSAY